MIIATGDAAASAVLGLLSRTLTEAPPLGHTRNGDAEIRDLPLPKSSTTQGLQQLLTRIHLMVREDNAVTRQ